MWAFREVDAYVPPAAMAGTVKDSMGNDRKYNVDGFLLMEVIGPVIGEGWELVASVQTGYAVRFLFRKQTGR